jgi:hypothetical protein
MIAEERNAAKVLTGRWKGEAELGLHPTETSSV